MSEAVLIKEVGGEKIVLFEFEKMVWNLNEVAMLGSIYALVSIAVVSVTPLKTINELITFGFLLPLLVVVPVSFIEKFNPACYDIIEYYCVRLEGTYEHDIDILKTSPDIDQREICKAAKKLEEIAREYEDEKTELKQIAERCR